MLIYNGQDYPNQIIPNSLVLQSILQTQIQTQILVSLYTQVLAIEDTKHGLHFIIVHRYRNALMASRIYRWIHVQTISIDTELSGAL